MPAHTARAPRRESQLRPSRIVLFPDGRSEFHNALAMTLRHLKWIAILAPIVVVAILEVLRVAMHIDTSLSQTMVMNLFVVAGIVSFQTIIFRFVAQLQGRLRRQNEELLALHSAGLDVASDLSLDSVLDKVVEQARTLVGAKYGAVSVIGDDQRIKAFITAGITPEQAHRIGPPPVGHGLLGVVLNESVTLRMEDIQHDRRSVGFPAHHPPMHSLLAVPILCKGPFRGNLYLTEKHDGGRFTQEDEETLARFALQAAIAIDNAHLHEQVAELAAAQERLRIAHEMHDGLAQVLGYVNTKAQAVNEYLKRGKIDEASAQLRSLAESAREAYTDVREAIVGLRTLPTPDRPFAAVIDEYVDRWKDQTGLQTQLKVQGDLRLKPALELQIIRILQEALTNVRKHAKASSVAIEFTRSDGRLEMTIQDDGIGISNLPRGRGERPRFGLTTMRERAESVGGSLDFESRAGGGTIARLTVPLPTTVR